jgi:hypothetical protein
MNDFLEVEEGIAGQGLLARAIPQGRTFKKEVSHARQHVLQQTYSQAQRTW